MQRVRLYNTLVGRSEAWKRNLPKDPFREYTNDDTFLMVKDAVIDQFGNRSLMFVDEESVRNGIALYPKFYSAGWFVSLNETPRELVIICHDNTMEGATKKVMETIQNTNWELESKEVPLD